MEEETDDSEGEAGEASDRLQPQFENLAQSLRLVLELLPYMLVKIPPQNGAHEPAPARRLEQLSFKRLLAEVGVVGRMSQVVPDLPFPCGPVDESLSVWAALIPGPVGSPYEGGTFVHEISFRGDYPWKPPRVRMLTKAFHPGVTESGFDPSCLDLTKEAWSPALTIKKLALAYQSALECPNFADPLVVERAHLRDEDPERYDQIAREWTARFAGGGAKQASLLILNGKVPTCLYPRALGWVGNDLDIMFRLLRDKPDIVKHSC